MSGYYGFIRHPETGEYIARVQDGKITAPGGISYSLVGDMIVASDGTELGYLGPFIGLTKGTGDLANQLFPRRLRVGANT
jgi:enoyl-CoA hydratase/carnithine racemase